MSNAVQPINLDGFISWHPVTVPAGVGKIEPRDVAPSSRFRCTEASARFEMRIGTGPWIKWEFGLGYKMPGNDRFSHLEFRNLTSAILTLEFYAGTIEIDDYRLNVRRDRDMSVITRPQCPFTTGHGSVVVTGGSQSAWYAGTSGDGRKRYQFHVANGDPVVGGYPIFIVGQQSANSVFAVFPQESKTFEASDNLILVNPQVGHDITCVVGETFYPDFTTITV